MVGRKLLLNKLIKLAQKRKSKKPNSIGSTIAPIAAGLATSEAATRLAVPSLVKGIYERFKNLKDMKMKPEEIEFFKNIFEKAQGKSSIMANMDAITISELKQLAKEMVKNTIKKEHLKFKDFIERDVFNNLLDLYNNRQSVFMSTLANKGGVILHTNDLPALAHEVGHSTNPKSFGIVNGLSQYIGIKSPLKSIGAVLTSASLPDEVLASIKALKNIYKLRGYPGAREAAKKLLAAFGTYVIPPALALSTFGLGYGATKKLNDYLQNKNNNKSSSSLKKLSALINSKPKKPNNFGSAIAPVAAGFATSEAVARLAGPPLAEKLYERFKNIKDIKMKPEEIEFFKNIFEKARGKSSIMANMDTITIPELEQLAKKIVEGIPFKINAQVKDIIANKLFHILLNAYKNKMPSYVPAPLSKTKAILHTNDLSALAHEVGHSTNPGFLLGLNSLANFVRKASPLKSIGTVLTSASLPDEALASIKAIKNIYKLRGYPEAREAAKKLLAAFGTYAIPPALVLSSFGLGYGATKKLNDYLQNKNNNKSSSSLKKLSALINSKPKKSLITPEIHRSNRKIIDNGVVTKNSILKNLNNKKKPTEAKLAYLIHILKNKG